MKKLDNKIIDEWVRQYVVFKENKYNGSLSSKTKALNWFIDKFREVYGYPNFEDKDLYKFIEGVRKSNQSGWSTKVNENEIDGWGNPLHPHIKKTNQPLYDFIDSNKLYNKTSKEVYDIIKNKPELKFDKWQVHGVLNRVRRNHGLKERDMMLESLSTRIEKFLIKEEQEYIYCPKCEQDYYDAIDKKDFENTEKHHGKGSAILFTKKMNSDFQKGIYPKCPKCGGQTEYGHS